MSTTSKAKLYKDIYQTLSVKSSPFFFINVCMLQCRFCEMKGAGKERERRERR